MPIKNGNESDFTLYRNKEELEQAVFDLASELFHLKSQFQELRDWSISCADFLKDLKASLPQNSVLSSEAFEEFLDIPPSLNEDDGGLHPALDDDFTFQDKKNIH